MTTFLRTEDVADVLGMSARSVAELTRLRRIPMRKLPGVRRVLVPEEELRAWIDAGGGLELVVEEQPRGGLVVKPKAAA